MSEQTPAPSAGVEVRSVDPAAVPVRAGRNGGRLLTGNRKARGAPPSVVRQRVRGSFAERVKILEEIADNPTMLPQDRIRAVDTLGKYGLGHLVELSVEQVREKLRRTLEVVTRRLPPAEATPIINELRRVWTT